MKNILKRIVLKLTSAKLLITIWAMVMVSYMVFTQSASENQGLVMLLGAIPPVYCGLNVVQKNIENRGNDNEQ